MSDFNKPANSDLYTDILGMIRSNNEILATMNFESATNVPLNSIKWSDANSRFERYNGSSWVEFIPHATTTVRGPVILSNSTNSTSQSYAATSNALRNVNVALQADIDALDTATVKRDGSASMTADLNLNGHRLDNVDDVQSRSTHDLLVSCVSNGDSILFRVRTSGGATRNAFRITANGDAYLYGNLYANNGSV